LLSFAKSINAVQRRGKIMSKKRSEELERLKMEAASEVGVDLKNGYNGELSAKQNGSIGGRMVKKMIEDMENRMK
jgi:hypothetical protein